MQLKKILFKPRGSQVGPMDTSQSAPQVGGGQGLIYNEAAVDVNDVGSGAFDRFDSPIHTKENNVHVPKKNSVNVPRKNLISSSSSLERKSPKSESAKLQKETKKSDMDVSSKNKEENRSRRGHSSERGYHSACSADSAEISSGQKNKAGKKKKKKKRRRSRSKSKSKSEELKGTVNISKESNENDTTEDVDKNLKDIDNTRCHGCLMENCGKSSYETDSSPIDFSFIFKDDKPIISEKLDKEAVTNPEEPIRIEEHVRTRKKKEKKRRRRTKNVEFTPKGENTPIKKAMGLSINMNKVKSKVNSKEKGTKSRGKKKQAPIPVRDMSKFQAQENLINFGRKGSDSGISILFFISPDNTFHTESEEEEQSDDYYILEADISSVGGYINFMSVSVPVDILEPEVIQRRSSNAAPISPR